MANLSRWAFLLTFAGVGLRTDLREMRKQGLRPFVVGAVGEFAIAGLTLVFDTGSRPAPRHFSVSSYFASAHTSALDYFLEAFFVRFPMSLLRLLEGFLRMLQSSLRLFVSAQMFSLSMLFHRLPVRVCRKLMKFGGSAM